MSENYDEAALSYYPARASVPRFQIRESIKLEKLGRRAARVGGPSARVFEEPLRTAEL